MSWTLTTCRTGAHGDGRRHAAIRRADGSLVVPELLAAYDGLVAALADWDRLEAELPGLDVDALEPIEGIETLSLEHPRKVLCVGANFRDHIAEMGVEDVPQGVQPYFFLVPPSTTLIPSGADVVIPADPSYRVDWEAELALVIGRGGRDIRAEDAPGHIAGFACFNDVTARGLLRRHVAVAAPFDFDWTTSKGQDTFCPIGSVSPAWMIEDPMDLTIRCLVNDEVKQDGRTSAMVTGINEIVAAASRHFTLEPGDVIATGTPAGVGQSRGEQLTQGDVVRVEITGLAPLENRVVFRGDRVERQDDDVLTHA